MYECIHILVIIGESLKVYFFKYSVVLSRAPGRIKIDPIHFFRFLGDEIQFDFVDIGTKCER
jgi:hypothetical protein